MTAIVLCCCGQLSAENKALKGDLERALEGKTFVSTVVLGGKAVPRGYSTDYPVNTIVSSDGQVTYRVEWGLMRTDVALREIRRRFDRGTSFRVTTVDLKDDRLELKLENATGDSAKLKLLLGSNWQSQMDVAAVLNALSHVLLDQQHYDRTQSQASLVQDQTKARVESGQISTRTANEVSQLRATSNQLYIQTQYAYGVSSYSGKDYQAAFKYLSLAADQGEPRAQYLLGVMYRYGRGVPQDYKMAEQWYSKASEQGNSYAQRALAEMYFSGLGVPQDEKRALELFRHSAQSMSLVERFWNGESCYFGRNMPRNDNVSDTPVCSEQDFKNAFLWFTVAAEQGHTKAKFYLGAMHEFGQGVPQDYARAIEWYKKAADEGSVDAQFNLGILYYAARGVPQDYAQAFQYWSKAAEQGDARAQANLGTVYEKGQGLQQDYKKAADWYSKAAQQGNVDGQFNLGRMYEHGYGVKQDYPKAFDWYKEAANHGDANAKKRAALIEPKVDAVEQAYATGFNLGGPDGGLGVELVATVMGTSDVRVLDGVGNVVSRPMVTFRLDFNDSTHKEWYEAICLHKETAEGGTSLDCNSFVPGKRYRLVASTAGSLIEFHPVKAEYPGYLYQGWRRCSETPTNCYRLAVQPIRMIRRSTGEIER